MSEAVERAGYLLSVAAQFIRDHGLGDKLIEYDDAQCDGECLADDCVLAAEALASLTGEGEPVAWRDALELAYQTFSEYADLHRAKGEASANIKADRNARLATVMYEALRTRPPVACPDREAVASALHARYEERARQRGQIGGDGYTVLGGARLEDCSRSLRQSFLEDADAVLSLLTKLKGEGQ